MNKRVLQSSEETKLQLENEETKRQVEQVLESMNSNIFCECVSDLTTKLSWLVFLDSLRFVDGKRFE